MAPILEISNLSKRYRQVQALDNVTLTVEQGNIYGILGPNGSGKTTTLAITTGIVEASSGFFRWFGGDNNATQNHLLGVILEVPIFYPYLTVKQNLKIVAQIKGYNENLGLELARILEIVKLEKWGKMRFDNLSLGMKQRMAIASTLIGDPKVLIFDEPTNGLDPQGIADVREIIQQQAAQGKTIIIASHILSEVEKVCTHAAILKSGKLLVSNDVKSLFAKSETVIVKADDLDNLMVTLSNSSLCKHIEKTPDSLRLTLAQNIKPTEINAWCFQQGIVLSSFEVHQKSLEEGFLEAVNNKIQTKA